MKIVIKDETIRLGQLLKKMKVISTGGQARWYMDNNDIKVNGEKPQGRGTTVKVGSTISINNKLYEIVNE